MNTHEHKKTSMLHTDRCRVPGLQEPVHTDPQKTYLGLNVDLVDLQARFIFSMTQDFPQTAAVLLKRRWHQGSY